MLNTGKWLFRQNHLYSVGQQKQYSSYFSIVQYIYPLKRTLKHRPGSLITFCLLGSV